MADLDLILRYLEDQELPLWDALVAESPQGCVFCYSWWLKTVAEDVRVLGCFKKSRLIAGMPIYIKRRGLFRIVTMPKLTQTWGVVLAPVKCKRAKALSHEMRVLEAFAARVSEFPVFLQSFSPNLPNWLAFFWKGFQQTSRMTYVLDNLSDLEEIWRGFKENIRTDIRKAERLGIRVLSAEPDHALPVFEATFSRQRMAMSYSGDYLRKLYDAASAHNAGQIFVAQDLSGSICAGAFMVWDAKRAYYLAGGGDPALRNSGATSFLLWHLIKEAAQRSMVFDFEGSMIPSIERFFRAFGGKQVYYNVISRMPILLQLAKNLRESLIKTR